MFPSLFHTPRAQACVQAVVSEPIKRSQLLHTMTFAAAFGKIVAAEVRAFDAAHPHQGGCSAGTAAGALTESSPPSLTLKRWLQIAREVRSRKSRIHCGIRHRSGLYTDVKDVKDVSKFVDRRWLACLQVVMRAISTCACSLDMPSSAARHVGSPID